MKKAIVRPLYNYIVTERATGRQETIRNCIMTYQHEAQIDFILTDTKYKTFDLNEIDYERE